MRVHNILLLVVSIYFSSSFALPQALRDGPAARGVPTFNRTAMINKPRWITKRGEPNTDASFPDDDPAPAAIDKVETAIEDALQLINYVQDFPDDNILAHYFDPADATEIRRIFSVLSNDGKGAEFLNNVLITQDDPSNACSPGTLAYTINEDSANPQITICPDGFKKKALRALNGAANDDFNLKQACSEDGGEVADNVSYVFNTLGMTLLHEYMHIDRMVEASFGSIIDDPSGSAGYGPVNVYTNLPKNLAGRNADSYAYFASEIMWSILCQRQFRPPRPGIDDRDPDCGDAVCGP